MIQWLDTLGIKSSIHGAFGKNFNSQIKAVTLDGEYTQSSYVRIEASWK